jgi:dipeptidyl aminopeptidase/acylaminoacyl peptidase
MRVPGFFRVCPLGAASIALILLVACDLLSRPPALIPRAALFSEPTRYQIRVSPDGRDLSFLAPSDGAMNIWLAPRDSLAAARLLTHEKGKSVDYHRWAADGHTIVYEEEELGTETTHVATVDVRTDVTRDLTPIPGVQAKVIATSLDRPDEILIGLNARDPKWHDVYRAALSTGALTLVEENRGFAKYVADNALHLRLAVAPTRNGGLDIYAHTPRGWKKLENVPPEDALNFEFVSFDRTNEQLTMIDSRGRDRSALVRVTLSTGAAEILGADPEADIAYVLVNPLTGRVQAYEVNSGRSVWRVVDDGVSGDLKTLAQAAGPQGAFVILSRTHDDKVWVLHIDRPTQAGVYYLFDRATKKLTALPTRPALEGAPLRPMYSARITARDGLPLLVYYTLAASQDARALGKAAKPAPLVLAVHSGPWARDLYGFSAWHQWLANRGYAVLSVNYRGSTGFGKAFLNAADGEWGAAMQNDLADAVDWAIAQGIADRTRVAIIGSQYGGYAALAGLAFSPKTYACGVSFGGPANLVKLLEDMPPYWTAMRDIYLRRVGNPATPEGRARLLAASPATRAGEIERPLLVAQGANDPVASEKETANLVRVLKEKGVPVTYVRYPDESGGLSRAPNKLSFHAVAEAFLGKCLGGRVEPIGADLKESSLEIVEGGSYVPDLIEALAALNTH